MNGGRNEQNGVKQNYGKTYWRRLKGNNSNSKIRAMRRLGGTSGRKEEIIKSIDVFTKYGKKVKLWP